MLSPSSTSTVSSSAASCMGATTATGSPSSGVPVAAAGAVGCDEGTPAQREVLESRDILQDHRKTPNALRRKVTSGEVKTLALREVSPLTYKYCAF